MNTKKIVVNTIMKQFIIYGAILIISLSLWACNNSIPETNENKTTENLEENIGGTTLFSDNLYKDIIKINYYFFDERNISIDDIEKIKEVLDLLGSLNYQKLEEDKKVEGLYLFDLVAKSETYSLGIGKDIIAFHGNQYKVDKKDDDLASHIFEILEIELESE